MISYPFKSGDLEILGVYWGQGFGIVLFKIDDELKVYGKDIDGIDEKSDVINIATWGSPMPLSVGKSAFPFSVDWSVV
jgi:hypothetical protein